MVHDFGIEYTIGNNLQKILLDLRFFTISVDMNGDLCCGITSKRDYRKYTVRLRIPEYIRLAIERFQHRRPTLKTDDPHEWK